MPKKEGIPSAINVVPPARPFASLKIGLPTTDKKARKMTGREVAESIRGFADGWNPETEKALDIPGEMHYLRNEQNGTMLYSKEDGFGIAEFLSSLLSRAEPKPNTEYGIAVYETAGSMYFVLVDMRRRIAVREQLLGYHDDPHRKDWVNVVKAIERAEAAAAAAPGRVAVHDGVITRI